MRHLLEWIAIGISAVVLRPRAAAAWLMLVAVAMLLVLMFTGCNSERQVERRVERIFRKNPTLLSRILPADTVLVMRDTTVYLPGDTVGVHITDTLLEYLAGSTTVDTVILRDSATGITVRMLRAENDRLLRMIVMAPPDTVPLQIPERTITRVHTVTEAPEWISWLIAGMMALAALATVFGLMLVRRRNRREPP